MKTIALTCYDSKQKESIYTMPREMLSLPTVIGSFMEDDLIAFSILVATAGEGRLPYGLSGHDCVYLARFLLKKGVNPEAIEEAVDLDKFMEQLRSTSDVTRNVKWFTTEDLDQAWKQSANQSVPRS